MVEKFQRDISDMASALYEEGQIKAKQQLELDSKDSEIEQLRQKLALMNADSTSVNSGSAEEFAPSDDSTPGKLHPPPLFCFFFLAGISSVSMNVGIIA